MSTTLIRAERPLFEGADWEFSTIQRCHDAIQQIAVEELGLNCYPNQIEVIGTEQMLDAYSSIGMPLFYKHWSFGKHFAHQEASYRKGFMGLAYEIVINSSPCISYLMEENTATMQTLVIAHAAFGHNHFFKNNYLFKQWTDAEGILDYLDFAKSYVAQCEDRYGRIAVEFTLDAAHALQCCGEQLLVTAEILRHLDPGIEGHDAYEVGGSHLFRDKVFCALHCAIAVVALQGTQVEKKDDQAAVT